MNNNKFSSLFIASALALSLAACGQKTSEESVASANQFVQAGKLDAAIIELKNAVKLAPEDAAVRTMLGKLYFEAGQLAPAEKELTKAQELGGTADDILPLLMQVYYHSDQFEMAFKKLKKDELTEPQAISTTVLFQYLASLHGQEGQASLDFDLVKSDLSASDQLIAEAYGAFHAKDSDKTNLLLQQLKDNQQRPAEINYLQAMFSYQQADFTAAVDHFSKVKKLVPVTNSVNFRLIEALINAKQLDEAEMDAQKLYKINKEHSLVNLYLGNIAYQRQQYENALGYSEKAVQNGTDSITARMIAGVSAYKLKSFEKAYVHLSNLTKRTGFQNDDISRILAHVQLNLGYTDEAANSLKSLVDLNTGDADLFSQTGMKLAAIGDLGAANELLGKATELDETNISTKLRAAMINIGNDETAVINGLKDVLSQDETLAQGWMQLAMAHVRNGDEKSALQVAEQWTQRDPANGKALKGAIFMAENKFEKAVSALQEALSIEPEHMGANQYLLQAYGELKQNDELYLQAQSVLKFAPNDMFALTAMVSAAQRLNISKDAESFINEISAKNDDAVAPYIALALSARLQGKVQNTIDILADRTAQLNPMGYMLLGDAYLSLGQNDQALNTYLLWEDKYPDTLIPALRAIGVNELKGNDENALKLTEKALMKFPERPILKMLQLNYLTKLGQVEAAREVLQSIKTKENTEQSELLDFYEGQLALRDKNYPKAEALLRAHYKSSPSFTSAMMLAKAMQGNSHIAQARDVLETELAKQGNISSRSYHTVAEFYLYNGLFQEAATLYEKIVEMEGETPVSLNNLAYVLHGVKKFDKARETALKALELAPDTPSILDTLGWIEYESGNTAEAYKHLSNAVKLAPKDNGLMLHLAEIQITIGQKEQAKALLKKLSNPSKKESAKRDTLLKQI
jgi:putative PEP-CTERM system TPR-repeat lipoprotein